MLRLKKHKDLGFKRLLSRNSATGKIMIVSRSYIILLLFLTEILSLIRTSNYTKVSVALLRSNRNQLASWGMRMAKASLSEYV